MAAATTEDSADSKEWDRLAEGMEYFHERFRSEYKSIHQLAGGSFAQAGMTLPEFLAYAEGLYSHLEAHHNIEERYIFPILAEKMDVFKRAGQHIGEHRDIHRGLDAYGDYVAKANRDPSIYDGAKLRELMDAFYDVLFTHLDTEVETLRGENLRNAQWTLAELRRIPMM